jgi:hypothetical protein
MAPNNVHPVKRHSLDLVQKRTATSKTRSTTLTMENYMDDFLVQGVPIMADAWGEILQLLRALAKLFGW